jgi:hypothetical protein
MLEIGSSRHSYDVMEDVYGNRRVEYLHRSTKDYRDLPEAKQLLATVTQGTGFNPSVALLRSILLFTKAYSLTDLDAERARSRIVATVALLARQVEKETNEAQTELLDEFDRAISQKWPSEVHYASQLISSLFQIYFKDTNPNPGHDFLSLAIISQVSLYVEAKFRRDKSIIRDKQGIPYLSYSLAFGPLNQGRSTKGL